MKWTAKMSTQFMIRNPIPYMQLWREGPYSPIAIISIDYDIFIYVSN